MDLHGNYITSRENTVLVGDVTKSDETNRKKDTIDTAFQIPSLTNVSLTWNHVKQCKFRT